MHEMAAGDLRFPFKAFPRLKCAIAYGSCFLPPTRAETFIPGLPDFILVTDESVAEWHNQNRLRNPNHYPFLLRRGTSPRALAALQNIGPHGFFSPLSVMRFPSSMGTIAKMTKYIVTSEAALLSDLNLWNDFYLAGRLQKPALIINSSQEEGPIIGPNSSLTSTYQKDPKILKAIQQNALNALRVSLLLSGNTFTLRDFLKTTATLSYIGDARCHVMDETVRARSNVTINLLPFIHLYVDLIPKLREEWKLLLDEGDEEILNGRYRPEDFDKSSSSDLRRFNVTFRHPEDEKILLDICDKTSEILDQHVKEAFVNRLMGDTSAKPLNKNLVEAAKLLSSREFIMDQSFSSESHCSMFHSLPDALQKKSKSISARTRLSRIFNPFYMIDQAKDREILGGPLPWESSMVEAGVQRLVGSSSRAACAKGLLMAGPTRACLYSFQKWCRSLSS